MSLDGVKLLPQWPCLSLASSDHSNWHPALLDPQSMLPDGVPNCWGDKGGSTGWYEKNASSHSVKLCSGVVHTNKLRKLR